MLNFGNHISVRNSSGKESGDLNCLDKENILRLNLFQRAAGRESENTSQLTGLIESSLVMGGILEGNYTLYGSSWRGTTFSHSIEIIRFVKGEIFGWNKHEKRFSYDDSVIVRPGH